MLGHSRASRSTFKFGRSWSSGCKGKIFIQPNVKPKDFFLQQKGIGEGKHFLCGERAAGGKRAAFC